MEGSKRPKLTTRSTMPPHRARPPIRTLEPWNPDDHLAAQVQKILHAARCPLTEGAIQAVVLFMDRRALYESVVMLLLSGEADAMVPESGEADAVQLMRRAAVGL